MVVGASHSKDGFCLDLRPRGISQPRSLVFGLQVQRFPAQSMCQLVVVAWLLGESKLSEPKKLDTCLSFDTGLHSGSPTVPRSGSFPSSRYFLYLDPSRLGPN